MSQQTRNNIRGINLLWLNWVIVSGALSAIVIMSLWLKPLIMPLAAIALQICCWALVRANSQREMPICYLLPHIAANILFISAIIMLIVNFIYNTWIIHHLFDPEAINTEIPFITVLIIAPVTAVCSLNALRKGPKYSFCLKCKAHYGTPAERGFLGKIFSQEGTFQLRTLFNISLLVTIVVWAYYFTTYINVNLNAPDRFVFFIVPLVMFLISIIYMAVRYIGLRNYYSSYIDSTSLCNGPYTIVRFIMLHDDTICVKPPEQNPDKITDLATNRYDTPGNTYIQARKDVSTDLASDLFFNKTDIRPHNLKFLYSTVSGNADYNIFHFICYLNDEEKAYLSERYPSWQYISAKELHHLINNDLTNPLFSAEIIRLHTIIMAWKTYDYSGKRKYLIKNYIPTFRLKDMHKLNIDYNDPKWLEIANFNQDSPFFRIRRLWKNKFTGE